MDYQFKEEEEESSEESSEKYIQELHLTANVFTLYMTDRWDGMRGWEIILNLDENQIKLNLEVGYYASFLKADADAKVRLFNKVDIKKQ